MIWKENENIPQFSKEDNNLELLHSMSDSDRRDYLVLQNMRLAIFITQKYSFEEDYESIAMIGLIKAANTFNLDKGLKFSTYASRVIHNEILQYIRKSKRWAQTISFEETLPGVDDKTLTIEDTLSYEDDQFLNLEREERNDVLHKAIQTLPDKEQKIICLLYGIGQERRYKQREVADMLGTRQSIISRLEKKILKKIKPKLENY